VVDTVSVDTATVIIKQMTNS